MNREQVIQFAKQVGLPHWYETKGVVNEELLVKFAKLVAEHEREACAKVCEELYDTGLMMAPASPVLAAKIRARGQA